MAATSESPTFVAALLEGGAVGYAAFAAERLLELHPETAARFGDGAFRNWKEHLTQRIRELAAAISTEEPDLFVSQVAWSRRAFEARQVPLEDLRSSLECLRQVLDGELPESARALPDGYLARALAELAGPAGRSEREPAADSGERPLALAYLEAALAGDRREAIGRLLAAVESGLPIRRAYLEVLMAAQREVGRLWHSHQIGVAQERAVTETTHTAMALLAARAEPRGPIDKTVVAAPVPGNAHDLAIRMVADFFAMEGWRVVCLTGELPADELALGLTAFEADLLALSATLSTHLGGAAAVIRAARAARPEVKILLGGRVLARSPDLWRRLGADAGATTVEEAVTTGARLVGLSS